jgi:soluble lytic murein transglycosylase-like protein
VSGPAPPRRRAWLAAAVAGAALTGARLPGSTMAGAALAALAARDALAGAQVEEPLTDAVRTALSAAVAEQAPPQPAFATPAEREAHARWRARADQRLARHKADAAVRVEFLDTLWYESRRAGLQAALVLGLVQVESGFRKYAISSAGARGYMQVMPFWARLIGDGNERRLFHLQTNLRFGCTILRHYLDRERGDLFLALGRYNGSRGRTAYPQAVVAAQEQWPDA